MISWLRLRDVSCLLVLWGGLLATPASLAADQPPLVMVVMDPLAAELSCPCVKGYAQRDYKKLGEYLAEVLHRPVEVKFGESIDKGLVDVAGAKADVVIGKKSVVEGDARRLKLTLLPIASLTGKDGKTTQRGLIVVRAADPAKSVADLKGYRMILGPEDCDEKNSAARALLAKSGIILPKECPISASCSDGAAEIVEAGAKASMATVISSYAQPLLEGCGTIQKGDLRVVAETADIPFITAFVDSRLGDEAQAAITTALLDVRKDPLLRLAIESKGGFVPLSMSATNEAAPATEPAATPVSPAPAKRETTVAPAVAPATTEPTSSTDWPGWRGLHRDARVAWLPEALPQKAKHLWRKTLLNEGLGGPAVAQGIAVVGDRDPEDQFDVFHAVSADKGERKWSFRYPATGRLDYGNSPRATPLICDGRVYLQGAFGHFHCLNLETGKVIWKRHLREDFGVRDELVWGTCSSPLIVEGRLIVNPGAADASLVALDPATGEVIWQAKGNPAAFGSFIVARHGSGDEGMAQVIGFDKFSLGGWDVRTGKRQWRLPPPILGDFNVPTPLFTGERGTSGRRLVVATENNGMRLIDLQATSALVYNRSDKCTPDMHTPVAVGDRIIAAFNNKIFCFSADDLKLLWSAQDRALAGHISLIASHDRVLALTQAGELLLIDALASEFKILSRLPLFEEEVSIYAHPALVGERLYVRGPGHLLCFDLAAI